MRFALALVLALLAAPATAAPILCTRSDVAKDLLDRYGEHLMFQGVTNGNNLIELYASRDGGTWTIVRKRNGINCLMLFGSDWLLGPGNKLDEETRATEPHLGG